MTTPIRSAHEMQDAAAKVAWRKHRAHFSANEDYRQGYNTAVADIAKSIEALQIQIEIAPVAAGDREWPDIGPDPFQGPNENRTVEKAHARLRDAYTKQQPIVPNQTALVWRDDIGRVHMRLVQLEALSAMERDEIELLQAVVCAAPPKAALTMACAELIAYFDSVGGAPKGFPLAEKLDAIRSELSAAPPAPESEVERLRADLKANTDPVTGCEGCGAPLFEDDDYVSSDDCSGCWYTMTDAPSKRDRPCYAYRVGKPDARLRTGAAK